MTHPVLSQHPRIVELDQALADLQQAERASKARVARLLEPFQEALAKWEVEADQQVLRGEGPTPKPEAPDLGRDQFAAHLFLQRRTQLRAERKAALVEISGDEQRAVPLGKGHDEVVRPIVVGRQRMPQRWVDRVCADTPDWARKTARSSPPGSCFARYALPAVAGSRRAAWARRSW